MTTETQDDPTLQIFVEQSLEKLDQIENELIKLEKSSSPAGASVAQIYALTLALKESASLLEYTNINLIAGNIGNVLDKIFKNEITFTSDLLNVIIDTFDKLNELISNATLSSDYDIRIMTIPLEEALKSASSDPTRVDSKTETTIILHKADKGIPTELPNEFPTERKKTPSTSVEKFRKKFGIKKEIDLSSNTNPLGVSKAVSNSIVEMAKNCCAFKSDMSETLKFGLAKRHDVPEASVVVDNGAVDILDLILRLSAMPGTDHVLSYEFGLPEYNSVTALCGVELLKLPRSRNFSPPLDQMVTNANENTAAIIITNPDIPSGYGLPAEELATMATLLPKRTLLIVDERGVEFAWPEDDYSMLQFLEKIPNLIILRSFSWSFGIHGVRLGYALMSPEQAQLLEDSRLPHPISPLNLGAGLAALNHSEFYYSTIALIIRGRERIQDGLQELGCTVYPSQSNFVMFAAPIPATQFYSKMLDHGFKLRKLDEFGITDLLTVSIGNNSRNRMFLAAVENILSE
ncbi:MAG: phosphotransferase [Desulfovibrio sp. S3730MH75]|nr:MAG: phosphotransferase [Desulfovibrio sp. S3730MH75]